MTYTPAPAARLAAPGGPTLHRSARAPAVVIGLDCPTGLQTARILHDRMVRVIGIARDTGHPCVRTNVCERVIGADTTGRPLVLALRRLGRELGTRSVLFPCTDMSVLVVSRHRTALAPWFHIVLPDADVVELLVDKVRFYDFAQGARLPLPRTCFLRSRADAEQAATVLRFPAVLKPAVKTPDWEAHAKAKVFRVADAGDLLRCFDTYARWADGLVAQEWIHGGDVDHYTCNAYIGRGGDVLATLTTRKLRQWPVTGGQACLSVEVRDPAVEAATAALFQGVRHRGLCYLEMKRDVRTGEYLIVEPNIGRPTGRSATAEAAGVELLYTMYCDALGLPLPDARAQSYRGVKWIYLRRDLQAALYHWSHGTLTLRDWLASLRGVRVEALFAWRDPLPFCADLARAAALGVAGLRQRLRARTASGTAETAEADRLAAPVDGADASSPVLTR